jgi:hypothetical protein
MTNIMMRFLSFLYFDLIRIGNASVRTRSKYTLAFRAGLSVHSTQDQGRPATC